MTLTTHALRRLDERRIPLEAVEAVLHYGRRVHVRGACIRAVGRREVAAWARKGVDLRDLEGLQVVLSPRGDLLTAYRNHDFRSLRG